MKSRVLFFEQVDRSSLPYVGGKGANLGELSKAGFPVPGGFCVTTCAYRDFIAASPEMDTLLDTLSTLEPNDLTQLQQIGERIRTHLHQVDLPAQLSDEITQAWAAVGSDYFYAIRSSATAEDLPTASFAGQQDTYLNIKGQEALLEHIRKCWASLFTDRAISYRMQNGFDHRQVYLSAIVQRMVFPEISGIMFTADPVTGNRRITAIDASFGLGEALVSGIVSADLYQIKGNKLIKKQIAKKELAIYASPDGGTSRVELPEEQQTGQALPDEQAIWLAGMGREIETHFGSPQDIEWCIADNEIFILQSRPITTLYPVPTVTDEKLHLFVSIGHVQMMTEAMKPLGISVLKTLVPFKRSPQAESNLLQEAGGRLFLDLTYLLEYPELRKRLPEMLLNVDEMVGRIVQDFVRREEFRTEAETGKKLDIGLLKKVFPTGINILRNILFRENFQAIEEMNRFIADKVAENRTKLQAVSGPDRITQIQEQLSTLLPMVFMTAAQYMASALITYKLIENLSKKWLGDASELGSISKSPAGNVTTELGLALGDVADAARNYPAVIEYLKHAANETFWDGLKAVPGGEKVLPVFLNFFTKYGMRGTGEIDVTRPRWREAPTHLVPAILNHINGISPGQHRLNFLAGEQEAGQAAARLAERLRAVPGGFFKARRMKRLIKVHRALIGIREHPKYFLVQNLDMIKQAVLQEAGKLVAAGILTQPEEIYWFSLQEIKQMLVSQQVDHNVITIRKERFQLAAKLTPPRAITSEGEILTAKAGARVPPGALAGSPVSAGVVEGRARVILKLEEARMDKGDILVAPYTDPGWTPLFPLAAGLITEVGGLMTHGAVVAREYGIPAVAAVDDATKKIKDGQTIRVDGDQGFIEFLD